jgi:dethiobiotin synthetase
MLRGPVMTISMKEAKVDMTKYCLAQGIDLDQFHVNNKANPTKITAIVTRLYSGILNETILKAFDIINQKGIPVLTIIGDGAQATYLKEKAKN